MGGLGKSSGSAAGSGAKEGIGSKSESEGSAVSQNNGLHIESGCSSCTSEQAPGGVSSASFCDDVCSCPAATSSESLASLPHEESVFWSMTEWD